MPCSRPRRPAPAVLFIIFSIPAVLGGGCRSGDDVSSRLDEASRRRLEALPADARVLAAGRLASPADTLPSFGDDARVLGLTPGAVLVEIPRAGLARLGEISGTVSIWGDATVAGRVDVRLRTQLLAAWANEDPAPLEILATFSEDALDGIRERLEEAGATVRTVAGPVATLDATPAVVFRLLSLPGLVQLQRPRPLNLLDGQKP